MLLIFLIGNSFLDDLARQNQILIYKNYLYKHYQTFSSILLHHASAAVERDSFLSNWVKFVAWLMP